MKKLLYILFAIIMLTSCEDYLEVNPKNVLTVQSYDDVKALMGAYLRSYVESSTLSGTKDGLIFNSLQNYFIFQFYSDDLNVDEYLLHSFYSRNNKGLFLQSLDWFQGDFHSKLWKEHYQNIGFCNQVLFELSSFESSSDIDDVNIVKGEARVIRAYELFKLMQYFSPYNDNELGLPFNTDAEAVGSYDSERKTQQEVYDFITSELEDVLSYTTVPSSTYSIFYDKEIINGILAKVYHFKGGSGAGEESDYTNAIEHAKAVLNGKPITSIDDFGKLFTYDFTKSGLVKGSDHSLIVYAPYWSTNGGVAPITGYVPYNQVTYCSQELLDLFKDNDVRKSKTVGETGAFVASNSVVTKFANISRKENNVHFFLRTAELHLIIAESYARLGDSANAKSYLESFQATRYTDYQGYTGSDVLQEILDERRREFCFEYDMRWTDLVRLQTGFSRSALDLSEEGAMHTLEDGDYRFTQPIPQEEELEYNNKIEQNPGWSIL